MKATHSKIICKAVGRRHIEKNNEYESHRMIYNTSKFLEK